MKILTAEFVTSAAQPKQYPVDARPQIAFAGRSNVGKSSLINALLNRRNLVKTSATPGKTQLVNFFLINGQFYFVDLPGYGYAKAPKALVDGWAPLVEGYLKDTPQLRAAAVLLDARRDPDPRDRRMIEWLQHYGVRPIVVLTKADKLKRQEAAAAQRTIASAFGLPSPPLLTSAESGTGIRELWAELRAVLARE